MKKIIRTGLFLYLATLSVDSVFAASTRTSAPPPSPTAPAPANSFAPIPPERAAPAAPAVKAKVKAKPKARTPAPAAPATAVAPAPAVVPASDSSKVKPAPAVAAPAPVPATDKSAKPQGPYNDFTFGPITWQEEVKASRSPDSTGIMVQSLGVHGGYGYNRFFSQSWHYHHVLDLAIGNAKGKGTTTAVPDALRDQSWIMLTASPGIMWRTTPVSEIGFALPITYRYIRWKLESGSNFTIERGASFSAGGAFIYANRFSPKSGIQVQIAHQHMWDAVIWSASYDYVF